MSKKTWTDFMQSVESLLSAEDMFRYGGSPEGVSKAAASAVCTFANLQNSDCGLLGEKSFEGLASLEKGEREFVFYFLSFSMEEILSSTDCFLGEARGCLESAELSDEQRLGVVEAVMAALHPTYTALLYICRAKRALRGEDFSQPADFRKEADKIGSKGCDPQ